MCPLQHTLHSALKTNKSVTNSIDKTFFPMNAHANSAKDFRFAPDLAKIAGFVAVLEMCDVN